MDLLRGLRAKLLVSSDKYRYDVDSSIPACKIEADGAAICHRMRTTGRLEEEEDWSCLKTKLRLSA